MGLQIIATTFPVIAERERMIQQESSLSVQEESGNADSE